MGTEWVLQKGRGRVKFVLGGGWFGLGALWPSVQMNPGKGWVSVSERLHR